MSNFTPSKSASATSAPKTTVANNPVFVIRFRGVSASVFANLTERGDSFHKASIGRTYKDDSGAWKTSNTFSRDDLPVLELVVKQAWQQILELESHKTPDTEAV